MPRKPKGNRKKKRLTQRQCWAIIKEYAHKEPESTKRHKRYDRAKRRIRGYGGWSITFEEKNRKWRMHKYLML